TAEAVADEVDPPAAHVLSDEVAEADRPALDPVGRAIVVGEHARRAAETEIRAERKEARAVREGARDEHDRALVRAARSGSGRRARPAERVEKSGSAESEGLERDDPRRRLFGDGVVLDHGNSPSICSMSARTRSVSVSGGGAFGVSDGIQSSG